MFRSFFLNRQWFAWSVLGSLVILLATWYKVQLDVQINEWFGDFYNTVQEALATPNSVELESFLAKCMTFAKIAGIYILVAVILEFFVRHYIFRWRTAMNDFYTSHWPKLRHIEGAAQRVQEDTMRFARIVEALGVAFLRSIMTLIAFLPILWTLSEQVTELPWIGPVDHALVYMAIISATFGTVLLAIVGIKLPGLEFKNQRVEAAYRKELVFGEDQAERAEPPTLRELFINIRKNYFNLYKHYLYFDIAKWSYLQFTVIIPYIMLGPTIVAGAITLGVLQQILRAFGKVEESFQFLVNSWGTIVELLSIYKRLKAFELTIKGEPIVEHYPADA
ncbi:peptide antibiotic transporter SbmA [Pseudomonadales bacterium]|jgi:peptide/bleomycin uptake transporter|nr:peptide antibiotic transporter SbmA [Pseudomonadales bacterium]MDB4528684.1 peptide antibiotic transporter SbmA [Pseudomonadales bacterium]